MKTSTVPRGKERKIYEKSLKPRKRQRNLRKDFGFLTISPHENTTHLK